MIYPIVEGHGEVRAVPLLLRRISGEVCGSYNVVVLQPHRVPRGSMVAEDAEGLRRAIELGARKVRQTGEPGLIMVLLDADNDCPAELGPLLLGRVLRDDIVVGLVVANREYEAWFLAGAQSLREHRNVSNTAVAPDNPESIRGAKEYLERHLMVQDAVYQPTVDQAALTAALGLEEARAAPSFDKLCRDLCQLLATVAAREHPFEQ